MTGMTRLGYMPATGLLSFVFEVSDRSLSQSNCLVTRGVQNVKWWACWLSNQHIDVHISANVDLLRSSITASN